MWWLDANIRYAPLDKSLLIDQRFHEMYTDTENTWDGVLLGSSNGDRAWAAPLAYETYGMTMFPMTLDGNPFVLIPNELKEVLKRQNISFAVIELHGLSDENIDPATTRIRYVTDRMKRSLNWLDAVDTGLEYLEAYGADTIPGGDINMLRLSLYFPLIQFHSRLMTEDLTKEDFIVGNTKMKGVFDAKWAAITRQVELKAVEQYPEATQRQKELLDAVFDCGEENGVRLLFLNVATAREEETEASVNGAVRYVKENGYSVLDLNDAQTLEASGLDGDKDFYDTNHLNARGAHKFTLFVSEWIREQLEVPDHRGDEVYQSWEDAAEYYNGWYEGILEKLES